MADDVVLKDGLDDDFTLKAKEVGGKKHPAHISYDETGVPLFTPTNPGSTAIVVAVKAASFNRSSNTTAYASGQLLANSTVAGSVVPMQLIIGRVVGGTARCQRARLTKSSVTTANAVFRAHLYKLSPTPANGDGAAWLTNQALTHIGSFTFDMTSANAKVFNDGVKMSAVPDVGTILVLEPDPASQVIYALLEARGSYVPVSAETFTLALEIEQN